MMEFPHKSECFSLVNAAFSRSEYPADSRLVNGFDDESLVVANAFHSKQWQDLPGSFVYQYHWCLHFLSPAAFRYYLPAFLVAGLTLESSNEKEDLAGVIIDHVMYALLPPLGHDPSFSSWQDKMLGFSDKERNAIVSFLRALAQADPDHLPAREATEALERFWQKT